MTVISHRPQQIGPTDDTDEAPFAYHRHPFHVMNREQPRDFFDTRLLGNRHQRRRHHIAGGTVRSRNVVLKGMVEQQLSRHHRQPPIMPGQPLGFIAADQVAVADHANGDLIDVHNRNRADLVVEQELGNHASRFVGANGYNLDRHDVPCLHGPSGVGTI